MDFCLSLMARDSKLIHGPPELDGQSRGEIHDYYELLECKAARNGKKALKDAHETLMHEWLMEMEGANSWSTSKGR
jgi:hypothetical protein